MISNNGNDDDDDDSLTDDNNKEVEENRKSNNKKEKCCKKNHKSKIIVKMGDKISRHVGTALSANSTNSSAVLTEDNNAQGRAAMKSRKKKFVEKEKLEIIKKKQKNEIGSSNIVETPHKMSNGYSRSNEFHRLAIVAIPTPRQPALLPPSSLAITNSSSSTNNDSLRLYEGVKVTVEYVNSNSPSPPVKTNSSSSPSVPIRRNREI